MKLRPKRCSSWPTYDYPGNIRELSNFIERGVALSQGDSLGIEHMPQSLGALDGARIQTANGGVPTTLESQEAEHIRHVLQLAEGNRSQAARMLGIDRVSLWRKLKKLGIDNK